MAPAPPVGEAFFPLDEQLGLTGTGITPRAEETLVRLASWMPFAAAQELLQDLLGVQVSKATARRATEACGEAVLAVCEQEEERLKQEPAPASPGAEKQALSSDGAFVHLVGGEWVEVQSLTIAEVTTNTHGEVELEQISTFSRLLEAERFAEAALVETQRRGLDQATEVWAVQDGAVWLQGLVDYHRADAVRILDFPHAAEYVHVIGQAVEAAGGRLPTKWLEGVLHRLKHHGPERVLAHLAFLAARYPSPAIQEALASLQKREAHMQYPLYQQAGWPIGSGSVESANKVVVEARRVWGGHALAGPQRQSDVGAAQCRVQSALAGDLDERPGAAPCPAPSAAAPAQEASLGPGLLDRRLLGTGAAGARVDPSNGPTDGCGRSKASCCSSGRWLFLASAVSSTASFCQACCWRGLCKKMNRTLFHYSRAGFSSSLF
jgi:hypothetical protein